MSFVARILKTIGSALAVLLGVTALAFLLSTLSPTDPATRYFTDHGITPSQDQVDAKRAELGLDAPVALQYLSWLGAAMGGDLGTSYRTGASVASMLAQAMPFTVALTASALALTLLLSIPLGILCAYRSGSLFDRAIRCATFIFNALPMFFVALLLLYALSSKLHWFNVIATHDIAGMVMPTLALALPLSAWYIRQVRAVALDQLGQPYVLGLRARGIGERRIATKHVLRNMAVPLLTLSGISAGSLLGGTAIIESIFTWPGLGYLSVVAIGARDYPIVVGYALALGLAYLVINGVIDALCHRIDPRSRKRGVRR